MARIEISEGEGAEVLAAGGVVVREQGDAPLVAVIHRPRYGDWTLPKGKLEPGEGFETAALREVEEETGLRCEIETELAPVAYRDRKGRSKIVRYWVMRPLNVGAFSPNKEVDELRWLGSSEATELLTYDHDVELVREALESRG